LNADDKTSSDFSREYYAIWVDTFDGYETAVCNGFDFSLDRLTWIQMATIPTLSRNRKIS